MESPLTVRLWLKDEQANENAELSAKRKLIKPELDKQTGRFFIALEGYDSFQVGRLVPAELVDLVTVRQQEMDPRDLISSVVGIYAHANLQIVLDHDDFDYVQISISGKNLVEVQEAYNLFRQGKLSSISWEL